MIQQLDVENFTVFKKAAFEFGSQLNVFIGDNGTGKTQILKLIYAVVSMFSKSQELNQPVELMDGSKEAESFKAIFKIDSIMDLVNTDSKQQSLPKKRAYVSIKCDKHSDLEIVLQDDKNHANTSPHGKTDFLHNTTALYLPVHELLTIYPNYQSLSKMYQLPYDSTVDDAIARLGLPYKKETPKEYDEIVKVLENAIDGKIFLKNEKFYFSHENREMDVNMAAEGWRKLGMVLQLLKNGGLGKGMVLLWDEPEANLNPKLIRLIAKVIVELSHLEIQTFITTHSLFLLREIDMLVKSDKKIKNGDVRYFNFPKKGVVEQGSSPEELGDILLLDESIAQSDRFMAMED